jgi:hypothetical protein
LLNENLFKYDAPIFQFDSTNPEMTPWEALQSRNFDETLGPLYDLPEDFDVFVWVQKIGSILSVNFIIYKMTTTTLPGANILWKHGQEHKAPEKRQHSYLGL